MIQIGIYAKTFNRPTLEETLDAVVGCGVRTVQFNMACAGVPTLPDTIDPAFAERIRREMAARRITMAAVSGTFNMIDPDLRKRQDGLHRLGVLAAACAQMGTSVITLCTGTRDPENMWRRHPDNNSPQAWQDLIESLKVALQIGEAHNVTLAFEPEGANVISSARQGRRLLDTLQSPRLKVVIDGANLFHDGDFSRSHEVFDEAFALLGQDIILAHAKDLVPDGRGGIEWRAAGEGGVDYDYYLSALHRSGYSGALILHSLDESQVNSRIAFLRETLARVGASEDRA
jgi:sugar phosphate isomerase/epimerase